MIRVGCARPPGIVTALARPLAAVRMASRNARLIGVIAAVVVADLRRILKASAAQQFF
jgi:hypothetical protein